MKDKSKGITKERKMKQKQKELRGKSRKVDGRVFTKVIKKLIAWH